MNVITLFILYGSTIVVRAVLLFVRVIYLCERRVHSSTGYYILGEV